MLSTTARASNILVTIARLQRLISSHLREISCCRKELLLCTKDSPLYVTDREALELQIQSLRTDIAGWREEIECYQERYAQLLDVESAPRAARVYGRGPAVGLLPTLPYYNRSIGRRVLKSLPSTSP